MRLSQVVSVAGLLMVGAAPMAQATSVDYLDNTSNGATAGWAATVQTFSVDTISSLISYAFMGGNAAPVAYRFNLYDWTPDTPVRLYSVEQSWVEGLNQIASIGVTLTPGKVYAAEINYQGVPQAGILFGQDVYAGGQALWSMNPSALKVDYQPYAYDLAFRVTTAPVPEPDIVAMLLAGLGLLGVVARRKQGLPAR